ncbi:FkbM family methyltransferase [Pseudaestuariivita rosea]|uniref:FkbM family methyltransferase n=1 Tax=Pseudaestuariivita rosea TaxID=2763263 RepID=UPI001ABB0FA9|nr:FkbM family methyltransferase [Pseudaestuariivita rosea]
MTPDPAQELEKYKRRHDRNMRNSFAKGYLFGITSMLKPGDLVIDCGANIGDVTEPLAATGATVHCFEPDPYAFDRLSQRFRENDNVTVQNAAVGLSAGTVNLMRSVNFDDNPKGGSVKSTIIEGGRKIDESDDSAIEVDLIDFPAFLRTKLDEHTEIAFLKMDIEGAELDILEQMERDDLFRHIRCTVAETHENKFKALRPRFKALKERIAKAYPKTQVNLDWI